MEENTPKNNSLLYEAIFKDMQEGILVFSMNGRLTMLNPTASQIFGIGQDDIGKTLATLFLNDSDTRQIDKLNSDDAFCECILEAVYEKKTVCREIIIYKADRINIPLSVTTSYIVYQNEKAVTVVVQDITKLYELKDAYTAMDRIKKLNTELDHARQKAEAANMAKSKFLSGMSHEIRTPINSILGMNEMILRESSESRVLEYASNIKSASSTLLFLINDILDLSKLESGKMELINIEYSLSQILKDLWNIIYFHSKDKGLQIIFDIPEDVPCRLYGDEVRIRQIITNLLTNAVKYTEKGTVTVTLKYERTSDDTILLIFSVADTGIGIKQENIPLLFEAFRRIDEEKNRTIEGTGLGISITLSLLKIMNGTMDVESEYGKGSVFTIRIPQKIIDNTPIGKFDTQSATTASEEQVLFAPRARILVVDDNQMNLFVVKGLLKRTGVALTTAASGEECLELIRSHNYHIIFLDHMMPGMDGIETLKQIRQLENTQDIPVIVLTANAISGAREMYLEHGFSDFLTKPINSLALEKMIQKYLPKDLETEEENALLSLEKGLHYVKQNRDDYMKLLEMFINLYSGKKQLLEELIEQGDIKRYSIEVHGLKGNARTLGADKLADICFEHEKQSKAGNWEYVIANWEQLFTLWTDTVKEMETICDATPHENDFQNDVTEEQSCSISEWIERFQKCIDDLQVFRTKEALSQIQELITMSTEKYWHTELKKASYAIRNEYDDEKAISILESLWKRNNENT